MDQFEPTGHGRKKREDHRNSTRTGRKEKDEEGNNTSQFTKFKENIEYTVLMPGGMIIFLLPYC